MIQDERSVVSTQVETSLSLGRLTPFSRNFLPPDLPTKQAAAPTCVEINQCVGCSASMAWRQRAVKF